MVLAGLLNLKLKIGGDKRMGTRVTATVERGVAGNVAKFSFTVFDAEGNGPTQYLPSESEKMGRDGSTAVRFQLPVLSTAYKKPKCTVSVTDSGSGKTADVTFKISR